MNNRFPISLTFILLFWTGIFLSSCVESVENNEPKVLSDELFGISIKYDARPANLAHIQTLMTDFSIAYFKQDRAGLTKILSPDFIWHLHAGNLAPVGETKLGVNGMLEELKKRANKWNNVKYSNVEMFCTETSITQTFHIKGEDAENGTFNANGVDVYKIENGKLLSKDSYWKHIE